MPEDQLQPMKAASIDAIFLVWSKPHGSHRSQYIAQLLGMELCHVYFTRRRGAFYAALKYPVQALQTIWLLIRRRPRLVFVQDPPIPSALVVWLCGIFLHIDLVIDTHTQRKLLVDYDFLWGIRRFTGKRALLNIVTNDHLAKLLEAWDAPYIIMQDPPLPIAEQVIPRQLDGDFTILWINVAAVDEPRDVVQATAQRLPHIRFFVTGDYDRTAELRAFKQQSPENMIFTGYTPDDEYYQLVKSVDVVLTLTTWDHTFQHGACEAMWLGRPVITSDWQILRDYFSQGVIFVDNTTASVIEALQEMQQNLTHYEAEISKLNSIHRTRWKQQADQLMELIEAKL
jgi:glycosyltransferase involved in cell wall biosynthesis